MADPFFLLTLTGSAIAFALYLALRRPKRTAHPLRTRRQRALGIPAALITAVVTGAGAFLVDLELILEWWRWAALLSGVAMLYTGAVLVTPGWWRVPVVLLVLVPLVLAADAWMALPHRADYLDLPCDAPSLVVRENGGSESHEPTLALLRFDPPVGEDELMALRVLPGVRFEADSAERVWQPVVEVATADAIRIAVTLERYMPPLWWFPGSERVSQLQVSTADRTTTMSAASPRITWLRDACSSRTVDLVLPERSDQFLQPGVYALEYACGPTDTEDV